MLRLVVGVALCLLLGPILNAQATFFVDAASGDDLNDGSSSFPFATVNKGIDRVKQESGGVVKVHSGAYDWDHENAYTGALGTPRDPFPIVIDLDGITIEGLEEDPNYFPVLGEDLPDQDIEALLVIDGETGGREDILITGLRFSGSDVAGRDAPSALLVDAAAGYVISDSSVFSNNVCERGAMNANGSAGRPTIMVRATEARVSMLLESNSIEASVRGGVEVIAIAGEVGGFPVSVSTDMTIRRNKIYLESGDSALFGFSWTATGLGGGYGTFAGVNEFDWNVVRSEWTPSQQSQGFDVGVRIVAPEHTGYGTMAMGDNSISGCKGDGVLLSVDGPVGEDEYSKPNITVNGFVRNAIHHNGGSGLVLEWDADQQDEGAGYLFPTVEGCLMAVNAEAGILFRNLGTNSHGNVPIINCTIVYNGDGGIAFENTAYLTTTVMANQIGEQQNLIVRGNNGNGAQVTGVSGSVRDEYLDKISYSNWLTGGGVAAPAGQNNIDADPLFVDQVNGDFHIDVDDSPCIDAGTESNVNVEVDIDFQNRVTDGDYSCVGHPLPVPDMGFDEVPRPICP